MSNQNRTIEAKDAAINTMEEINTIKAFLWWIQTYFNFFDETMKGEYLFEGPLNPKNQGHLNPHRVLKRKPVYKKRNTQKEVMEMYRLCLKSQAHD